MNKSNKFSIRDKFKISLSKFLSVENKYKYNYIDVGSSLPLNNFISYFSNIFNLYLFEPNINEYEKLINKFQNHKNINLSKKAIGTKKNLTINLYSNKNLSSVLNINNTYRHVHPKHKLLGKIKIDGIRLDDLLKNNNNSILKIDAQGYSFECLKSAKNILNKIPVIIIEAEKVQMYKKQKLDFDIVKYLHNKNYVMLGELTNYNKSLNKKNRRLNFYFKEFTYSKDLFFIKNFFEKKLSYDQTILTVICLTLFSYCDLAFYLIQNSNLHLTTKKKLKNLVNLKVSQNKFIINYYLKKFKQNKISFKKLYETLAWTDEKSILK